MVKLLEESVVEMEDEALDLSRAGVIGMRDGIEYPLSRDCPDKTASGIRVYSCDADCDNCHCATY